MKATTRANRIAECIESIEARPIADIVQDLQERGVKKIPMRDADGNPYLNLGDTNKKVFEVFKLLEGYRVKSTTDEGAVLRSLLDVREGRMGYEIKKYPNMLYPKYLYRVYGETSPDARPVSKDGKIDLIASIIEEEVNDGYRVGKRVNWRFFSDAVALRGRNKHSKHGEPFTKGVLDGLDRTQGRSNDWVKAADIVPYIERTGNIVKIISMPSKEQSLAITERSIGRFVERLGRVSNGVIIEVLKKNGVGKRPVGNDIVFAVSGRGLLRALTALGDAAGCEVSIGPNSMESPAIFRRIAEGLENSRFRIETIFDDFLQKNKYRYLISEGGEGGEWPIARHETETGKPDPVDKDNKGSAEFRMARMLEERTKLYAEAGKLRDAARVKEEEADRLENEARDMFAGMLDTN